MIADISLSNAWLVPYSQDGRGTSVVVTRSLLAESIIQEGANSSAIVIEPISPDTMRASQQGSYNHRHDGLYVRVKEAKKKGIKVSEKRYGKNKITFDLILLQKLRRITRRKSLEAWFNTNDATKFDEKMQGTLKQLKFITRITHVRRKGFKHFVQRLTAKIMGRK